MINPEQFIPRHSFPDTSQNPYLIIGNAEPGNPAINFVEDKIRETGSNLLVVSSLDRLLREIKDTQRKIGAILVDSQLIPTYSQFTTLSQARKPNKIPLVVVGRLPWSLTDVQQLPKQVGRLDADRKLFGNFLALAAELKKGGSSSLV